MTYRILTVTDTTVTIWDRERRDKNGSPAGLMELHVGDGHGFRPDQLVAIALRLVADADG